MGQRGDGQVTVARLAGAGSDAKRRKAFGDALRRARETRSQSQESLGAAVGVVQTAVSRWEKGEVEPMPAVVFRLEKALRLSPGALSSTLGYMPAGPGPTAPSVPEAIRADPHLNRDLRRALLAAYDAMASET